MSTIYSVLDDERINARADFFREYGIGVDGSWASSVGSIIASDSEVENYNWIGSSPQMGVWQGAAKLQQLPNYSATLTNLDYAAFLSIDKGDLRRDKTGQIRTRIGALGTRAATHWEDLASDLLIASETAAGTDISGKSFTGQAHFDTDHSFTGSNYTTNQSNDLSAGVWNVATATAPTPDEAAKCVLDAIGSLYALKDDQGKPANGNAKSFTIMVGTAALWAPFKSAVGLDYLTSGASNPVMGLKTNGITIDVILNPRLSAKTTKVYVMRNDGDIKSLILQDEVGVSVEEEDPGITSKEIVVASKAVRAAGYGLFTSAVLGTLS